MTSPRPRRRSIKLDGRRLLLLVVSSLLLSPAAAADGVIVKSASSQYPVGSVVPEGEVLRLEPGQTVTVLDRSGVMVVRSAGAYAGPSSRESADFLETAAALATGPSARASIGGTRTGEDDPATACNEASDSTAADACIPRYGASKRLRVAKYVSASAGRPAQLVLESNFDGFAVCTGWSGSEDSRFLDGADPAHPIPLSAKSPVRLTAPAAGAGNEAAPAMTSIGCAGVSAEVWNLLKASAQQALAPNSAAIVMSSFSRMRGDTMAEDHATSVP